MTTTEKKDSMSVIDNLVSNYNKRNSNILANTNSIKPASFNELLIQRVKEFPELYDHQQRACTDNVERTKIWDMIAYSIDSTIPGEFAKKRWLQMRDRYRKELKLALRDNFKFPPKWIYFKELTWLDSYLKDCYVQAGYNYPIKRESEEVVEQEGRCDSTENNNQGIFVDSSPITSNIMLQNMISNVNDMKKDGLNNTDFYNEESRTQSTISNSLTPESCSSIEKSNFHDEKIEALLDRQSPCVIAPRIHRMRQNSLHLKRSFNQNSLRGCTIGNSNLSIKCDGESDDIESTNKKPKIDETIHSTILDWLDDEDFLFTKLIITRLSKLSPKLKKITKRKLFNLLDEAEDSQDV
uniref:MADF domain-containing protein n=1 Tax=Parastrongyloides trichosuri TaxID=131310 RepID=A0A0N4Z149_PARTI